MEEMQVLPAPPREPGAAAAFCPPNYQQLMLLYEGGSQANYNQTGYLESGASGSRNADSD